MDKKLNPTLVGAFVVGALFLVLFGVITFGSGRLFQKTYAFALYFDGSVNGLNIGAAVKAKGVEIGSVTDIRLGHDPKRDVPIIPVIIEIDLKKITSRGGTGLALTDPAALETVIQQQGLRGQLSMESFVTGLLYIDLDFHPGSPINYVQPPGAKYREIPTLPTALEEVQAEVKEVIANLKEIKIGELIDNANKTIEAVNRLVSSPEVKKLVVSLNKTLTDIDKLVVNVGDQVDPLSESIKEAAKVARDALTDVQKLVRNVDGQVEPLSVSLADTSKSVRDAMVQAKKTLSTADGVIAEDSPLNHDLASALKELSAAARSIRILANYLERHPEALIHGKNTSRR